MKKCIVSLLLVAVTVIGLLPFLVSASVGNAEAPEESGVAAKITEYWSNGELTFDYASGSELLAALGIGKKGNSTDNGTFFGIKLDIYTDMTLTQMDYSDSHALIEIDLHGHTVTHIGSRNYASQYIGIKNGTVDFYGDRLIHNGDVFTLIGDSNGCDKKGLVLENLTFKNVKAGRLFAIGDVGSDGVWNVENFTVKDGEFSSTGGAFYINKSEPEPVISFTDCDFIGIHSTKDGAAIYIENMVGTGDRPATLTFTGCNFIDCSTDDEGGAIYVYEMNGGSMRATLCLDGCNFLNCTSKDDGGAIFVDDENIDFGYNGNPDGYTHRSLFYNCSADNYGGAIYDDNGKNSFRNMVFVGNKAYYDNWGGGAMHIFGSDTLVSECEFYLNDGAGYGGAVSVDAGSVKFLNCVFAGNESENGKDIYIGKSHTGEALSHCTFYNYTSASVQGGEFEAQLNNNNSPYLMRFSDARNYNGAYDLITGISADDPVLIKNTGDMIALAVNLKLDGDTYANRYYKLTSDIGNVCIPVEGLTGGFDFDGHTLSVRVSDPLFDDETLLRRPKIEGEDRLVLPYHIREWITTKDATCTEDGVNEYICCICGETFDTRSVEKLGHSCTWQETKAPSCTEDGVEEYICSRCSKTVDTRSVGKLDHSCTWQEKKAPSCTEEGLEEYICSVCAETVDTRPVEKIDHSCTWQEKKAPSCTEDGLEEYICSVCAETVDTRPVEKLGHDPDEYDEVTHSQMCKRCGEYARVDYYDFDEDENKLVSKQYLSEITEISASSDSLSLGAGWYFIKGNVTVKNRIVLSEDVHFILADGCLLTAEKGIEVGTSFTVYAQSPDAETMGAITVPTAEDNCAGIGSGNRGTCGNITVNGGIVTVTGGLYGAGIGSGNHGYCGNVTINGGVILASGGYSGAGIGSGFFGNCGSITINGGIISASGGYSGAGIGSGYHGTCGDIMVNGGVIKAVGGGKDKYEDIGAGYGGGCGTVDYNGLPHTNDGSEWVNLTYIPEKNRSCLEAGYKEAYKNLESGIYYTVFPFAYSGMIGDESAYTEWKTSGNGMIPAIGYHVCTWQKKQDVTCTEDGIDEYICSECGETVDTNVTEKLGHDSTEYNFDGTHSQKCMRCGKYILVDYYFFDKEENKLVPKQYLDLAEGISVSSEDLVLTDGWYFIIGKVTVTNRIILSGDVHFILADGCLLMAEKGIEVGTSFTVYAQSLDAETMGAITVPTAEDNCAGIGSGNISASCGDITINGGAVTATGGLYGAGIGSGNSGKSGNITVNGGIIIATGGANGAGIGSGNGGKSGDITVNGGVVTAYGGSYGAGIGSGNSGESGNITINGGIITANGEYDGAGIGSGYYGSFGVITISGGIITANGGYNGAGIGIGINSDYPYITHRITINGGIITANGGHNGAGIGSGYLGGYVSITINGGVIKATGSESAEDIGAGYYGFQMKADYRGLPHTNDGSEWVNLTYIPEKDPTCTEAGYKEAYKDLTSGIYYTVFPFTDADAIGDENTYIEWIEGKGLIPAPGHDCSWQTISVLSCTEDGVEEYICARCKETLDTKTTEKLGHDPDEYDEVTHTQKCLRCGEYLHVDYYGFDEEENKLVWTRYSGKITEISVSSDDLALTGGWYFIIGKVTVTNRIILSGDVHFILADGCELTAEGGIEVGDSFTVYAQSLDAEIMGAITVPSAGCEAGIGSGESGESGDITINGGVITVTGGDSAAGIGSGYLSASCGDITINGGVVTANGGYAGAGIGSGTLSSSCGNITVNGGVVTANGGEDGGAGIGGGYNSTCGNITINGGTVTAYGGYEGAGIGGGVLSPVCGNITVNGGIITAYGGEDGAGIGGGYYSRHIEIDINGGVIKAVGGGDKVEDIGAGYAGSMVTVNYNGLPHTNDGSEWVNLVYFPENAVLSCAETCHGEAYKDLTNGIYYTVFPFTDADAIGDEKAYTEWKKNGEILPHTDGGNGICEVCGQICVDFYEVPETVADISGANALHGEVDMLYIPSSVLTLEGAFEDLVVTNLILKTTVLTEKEADGIVSMAEKSPVTVYCHKRTDGNDNVSTLLAEKANVTVANILSSLPALTVEVEDDKNTVTSLGCINIPDLRYGDFKLVVTFKQGGEVVRTKEQTFTSVASTITGCASTDFDTAMAQDVAYIEGSYLVALTVVGVPAGSYTVETQIVAVVSDGSGENVEVCSEVSSTDVTVPEI